MKYTSILFFLLLSLIIVPQAITQTAINTIEFGSEGIVYLEDFEKYQPKTIPEEWYNRDGTRIPEFYDDDQRSEYEYRVIREGGNQFLRYSGSEAKHLNFPLADKENLDIYQTPYLRWRWRIHDLPAGGNEDRDERNDVAASVYVVFDFGRVLFRRVPKSIRYTWSSTLPKGKELSKLFGNQKIVVVESGPKEKGKWKTFERNIVEDYRRLFGDDPPRVPLAILILSDGDNTNSYVQADYDDFELHPEKP